MAPMPAPTAARPTHTHPLPAKGPIRPTPPQTSRKQTSFPGSPKVMRHHGDMEDVHPVSIHSANRQAAWEAGSKAQAAPLSPSRTARSVREGPLSPRAARGYSQAPCPSGPQGSTQGGLPPMMPRPSEFSPFKHQAPASYQMEPSSAAGSILPSSSTAQTPQEGGNAADEGTSVRPFWVEDEDLKKSKRMHAKERAEKRRMEKLSRTVLLIQRSMRGILVRVRLKKEKQTEAALMLQRMTRGSLTRGKVQVLRRPMDNQDPGTVSQRRGNTPAANNNSTYKFTLSEMTQRTQRVAHARTDREAAADGVFAEYMARKCLNELMGNLGKNLVIDRPANHIGYLTEYLQRTDKLVRLAARGELDAVTALLDEGVFIDAVVQGGETALSAAARNGHADLVELLAQEGAKVDALDDSGATPLWTACEKGHRLVAAVLLHFGADPNAAKSVRMVEIDDGSFGASASPARAADEKRSFDGMAQGGGALQAHAQGSQTDEEGHGSGFKTTSPHVPTHAHGVVETDVSTQTASNLAQNDFTRTQRVEDHQVVNAGAGGLDVGLDGLPHGHIITGVSCVIIAAERGRTEILERLAVRGADLNMRNGDGATSLFIAAERGYLDCVRFLGKHGASPTQRTLDGWSPLMVAVQQGHTDVVRHLIIDLDVPVDDCWDPEDISALGLAAQLGHIDIVRFLVDAGANIDRQDLDGATPLALASQMGHVLVVGFLAHQGASLDTPREDGTTPLIGACGSDALEMVRMLVRLGADLNIPWTDGATAVYIAAQLGHFEVVQFLSGQDTIDLDKPMQDGTTPLWIACERNHSGIARTLIKTGASLEAQDNQGWTPIFAAAQQNHEDMLALLVEAGANLDARADNHATPSYIAAVQGNVGILEMLRRHGANLHQPKSNGWTPAAIARKQASRMRASGPEADAEVFERSIRVLDASLQRNRALIEASVAGRDDEVEGLLYTGVFVDHVEEDVMGGTSALACAAAKGHTFIAELLIERGASLEVGEYPAIWMAAMNGHAAMVDLLAKAGANVDARTPDGRSALQVATLEGRTDIMKSLCEHGADSNFPDEDGATPLHAAAQRGLSDVVPLLMSLGADSNRRNNMGLTPLMVATQHHHLDILNLLCGPQSMSSGAVRRDVVPGASITGSLATAVGSMSIGAPEARNGETTDPTMLPPIDLDAQGPSGETALWMAASRGYYDVAQALLDLGADPNVPDKSHMTPAMVAASRDFFQTVNVLARGGADLEFMKPNGATVALVAAQNHATNTLTVLRETGADMTIISKGLVQ